MSTIRPSTSTLCSVGSTATVRMMSAATSSSRPVRIDRPSVFLKAGHDVAARAAAWSGPRIVTSARNAAAKAISEQRSDDHRDPGEFEPARDRRWRSPASARRSTCVAQWHEPCRAFRRPPEPRPRPFAHDRGRRRAMSIKEMIREHPHVGARLQRSAGRGGQARDVLRGDLQFVRRRLQRRRRWTCAAASACAWTARTSARRPTVSATRRTDGNRQLIRTMLATCIEACETCRAECEQHDTRPLPALRADVPGMRGRLPQGARTLNDEVHAERLNRSAGG